MVGEPRKSFKWLQHACAYFGKVDFLCCFDWDLQKVQDQTEKLLGGIVSNDFEIEVFYFSSLMKKA